MLYGYGQRNNLLFGFGGSASGSLAYSANGPRLALGGAATAYPPTLAVQLPFAAQTVGDAFRIVVSSNLAFSTIVLDTSITLTGNAATDIAAINATLASITSPAVSYIRCYCAGWSNVVQHGTAAAPTITSSVSFTNQESLPFLATITTSVPAYLAIASGEDQDRFELDGSAQPATSFSIRYTENAVKNYDEPDDYNRDRVYSFSFEVEGLNGAIATVPATVTLQDVDLVPDALALGTLADQPKSTLIEIVSPALTGVTAGFDIPVSVAGGEWRRNNIGAWGTAPGVAQLGDTFGLRHVTSANDFTATDTILTVGGVANTFRTVTPAPPGALPQSGNLGLWLDASDLATLFQLNTGATPVTTNGQVVGFWGDKSANDFDLSTVGNDTTRPIYGTDGSFHWVEFDGVNDILRRLEALQLYAAGAYTLAIAVRGNPAIDRTLVGEGYNTGSGSLTRPIGSHNATAANAAAYYRADDGATTKIQNSAVTFTTAWNNTDKVAIVTDDGLNLDTYVDGTLGTRRSYTRASGTFNLCDRFAIGGLMRNVGAQWFAGRIYAVAIWPGIVLNSTDRATVLTQFAAKQGRTL
jgi:hypothetical protein